MHRGLLTSGTCFAVAIAGSADAQQVRLPTREELAPAQRAPPLLRPDGLSEATALQQGPCPFQNSDHSFTLVSVDFIGLTAVAAERLDPAWRKQHNQNVDLGEICRIRDRAADILLASGFLARVEIPLQQISNGRLRLQVIEAQITSVRVEGSAGPGQRQVERYLGRLRGHGPFDFRVVQRQILLASDMPGVRIAPALKPDPGAEGGVELIVRVFRDPIEGTLGAHNLGSQALGPWNGTTRLDLNSFSAFGERTSVIFSTSGNFSEQRVLQLLEEVRIGGAGFVARGSLAKALSRPGGALAPLEIDGRSMVGRIEGAYPLVRHRRRNVWALAGLEVISQKTDVFAGAANLIDDQLRVAFARLEGDARTTRRGVLPLYLSGGIEVRKGLSAFGASQDNEPTLSRADGDPHALVIRADGRAQLGVSNRLSIMLLGNAQWANNPLLAYEEMAVGSLTIGRGYDPGEAAGDRGLSAGIEVQYGALALLKDLHALLFAFHDVAATENLGRSGRRSETLQSLGAGVRLGVMSKLSLGLTYAYPLDRRFGVGLPRDGRLLVNLVTRL